MHRDRLYLKRNIVVEPLVDNWYAWAHLVPPATTAMNIANRHLRIMESYVNSPMVHRAAAKNPRLAGGPFVDYDDLRVEEIKALIDETRRERRELLELAEGIKQLDQMLLAEADGFSLEPLYDKVSESLRGYVELVYDLNNQPSFRVIESLVYRSRYYDTSRQTLMLSVIKQDDRPFVLSTPHVRTAGEMNVQVPFASKAIDELFKMKSSPQSVAYIKDALGFDAEDDELFASFLTPEPPPSYEPYRGNGIRWRYFGHACILIETANINVLLDPVLSYTYESDISRYTYDDLPAEIDYVVITHNHQDHILFETILQLRNKVKHILVPRSGGGALQNPSLKLLLNNIGFSNVIELDEFDSIPIPGGKITGLPFLGEHADLNVRTKLGWLIQLGRHRLLFAADSCNVEFKLYEHIHDCIGDVDVLFLGMECEAGPLSWIYGALLTTSLERKKDRSRRLAGSNYQRGMNIVDTLGCKEVYVYAMGLEPWLNHVMRTRYTGESNPIVESNRLVEECNRRGITSERLFGEKEILLHGDFA